MNNETIGISAEIAIADVFNVKVSNEYRRRGNSAIENSIRGIVFDVFKENNIPYPIKHIAERQNPVDFLLEDRKTLSVKSKTAW